MSNRIKVVYGAREAGAAQCGLFDAETVYGAWEHTAREHCRELGLELASVAVDRRFISSDGRRWVVEWDDRAGEWRVWLDVESEDLEVCRMVSEGCPHCE